MSQRSLNDMIRDPTFSINREHLFHQVFTAELLKAGWVNGYEPIEIAHPEVDFQGYDLILTCGSATRHVQLKAGVGDIGGVDLHRALAAKPAGCVALLRPIVSDDLKFRYRFYGGGPSERLQLDGYAASNNTL